MPGHYPTLAQTTGPLPVVWIEVGGKTIPHDQPTRATGRLRIIEDHDGTLKAPQDLLKRPTTLDSTIGIEVRGNSSAGWPQKSFNVELRDAAGMNKPASVFGMPSDSDWVLYAAYMDTTLLRNAVIYELAREMSTRWSMRARFVEVFLDGSYNGVYLWVEKIKKDKTRVSIPSPSADATGDLTGGYILRQDVRASTAAKTEFLTKAGTHWAYSYPKADEITPAQKSYVQGYMDKFDAMMKSTTFADPATGYPAFIDLPSWVDQVMIQELTNNVDGYWSSSYTYKESDARGGKLYMWPVWDFDIAVGNIDARNGRRSDIWAIEEEAKDNLFGRFPFFWTKMWGEKNFQNALKCRWTALRKDLFSAKGIKDRIDAGVKLLGAAQARHDAKWKVIGRTLDFPVYVGKTYAENVQYMKDWIDRRLTWMDAKLPGTCPN